jgi:hypothetical protein
MASPLVSVCGAISEMPARSHDAHGAAGSIGYRGIVRRPDPPDHVEIEVEVEGGMGAPDGGRYPA